MFATFAMQNIYIYIYVYVYVYVFSPAVVIASRLMQPAKRCDCRDHFSYCHTFHTSAIRECTFLHLPLRLVIYFSPVPAFVHKTYFLFRGISFNLPARFHFMADISERISLHSISKLAKKKKKSLTMAMATELNLGSTVRDLFYPPLH